MRRILAGTRNGVAVLGSERLLPGRDVVALAHHGADLLALSANGLARLGADGTPQDTSLEGLAGNCVLASRSGVFVGTEKAHLIRVEGDETGRVTGFDAVPTREDWYTPWGGPADVRSMAEDAGGSLFVNVHVGGILRSDDGGTHWAATPLDIDLDVHQVIAHPADAGVVYAATAYGLSWSVDAGSHWETTDEGLDETYSRAVAIAGDTLVLTASQSHRGRRAAIYRRPLGSAGPFERCRKGLPDSFDDNIDTHCLAASGNVVAFGTSDGRVFVSEDEGVSWEQAAESLAAVRCVLVA